jgi:hypothetical protein
VRWTTLRRIEWRSEVLEDEVSLWFQGRELYAKATFTKSSYI